LAWRFVWILVAMVSARSAAMAFNRILDADIDGRNRRTAARHLPAGLLSVRFAWGFTAIASLVFLIAARQLGFWCLVFAPLVLATLFFYSFSKRFTLFSHLILGFCLGMAPAAAWIAMRGALDGRILWLTAAVMFWTAGFDVIYACQDFEFDHSEGLYSIPKRFGIGGALTIARLLHVAMIVSLIALAASFHLGPLSVAGIVAVVILLIYEHGLVKAHDLSRVNAAFFTVNGYVSLLFFAFWAADILLQHDYFFRS
jgi:4-hydroxybenzoate polyprenyltransferase